MFGRELQFPTKDAMEYYQRLIDIFTPDNNNIILHNNMEPAVRTSADNPLLNSPVNSLGWSIVDLILIPTQKYLSVYASSAPAYARSVRRVDHTDPGFDQDRYYNNLNMSFMGTSCSYSFCIGPSYCKLASAKCGGNNSDGRVGWTISATAGTNTGSNVSFTWSVTDQTSTVVHAGVKDGVAGTVTTTVGSGNTAIAGINSFSTLCFASYNLPPGGYTCNISGFTGGGNSYPDMNINGIVLGAPPLNCIPNDPNYDATCCVPTWNCSGAPNWTCSDPGDGTGQYSTQNNCQAVCGPTTVIPPVPPASDVNCIINNCDQH